MAHGYTTFEGHRLAYNTYGRGKRAVILIHGLLMSQRMQKALAEALAEDGNMCVTVDLAGHGESDPHLYNWDIARYAEAMKALIDDLELEQVVLIGTSLGANISLQVATDYPDRVRGMVIEMPALENAMIGGALLFGPFAALGDWAEPVARVFASAMRRIPEVPLPFGASILLDLAKRDPRTTVDVLKGLFYGQIAPTQEQRREIEQPVLVIGHKYDPIHPFNDAKDLAELLPDARLIEATSVVELRLLPARLTREVIGFVDECWRPQVVGKKNGSRPKPRRRKAS